MVLTRYGAHWVSAEDYMELEAQLAEAENQLDSARHSVDVLERRAEAARAEGYAQGVRDAASKAHYACGCQDECLALLDAATPAPPSPEAVARALRDLEVVRCAVARGWCTPANSSKEMHLDRAEAVVQEVVALAQIIAQAGKGVASECCSD
jgi:hypothetical protein